MAKILFLAHRLPFPPDKGDKIRAFHMIRHLSLSNEVYLGALHDDESELPSFIADKLGCAEVFSPSLTAGRRAFNMATALFTGDPLSVARFRHPELPEWIGQVLSRVRPDLVVIYSSALGETISDRLSDGVPLVIDFVDADAAKWRDYAKTAPWPISWVFRREAHKLQDYESTLLARANVALLVTDAERRVMGELQPQWLSKFDTMGNGVDLGAFPAAPPAEGALIVMCGRMDYRANVEGARWFAKEVFPLIRKRAPTAVFRIVGAAPTAAVRKLSRLSGIEVTGAVPEVWPHLAEAAVVVAPLRIARGIQNKVLEGLSAARAVVATGAALEGLEVVAGRDVLRADEPSAFAEAVLQVLEGSAPEHLAVRGREFVESHHTWRSRLAKLDSLVERLIAPASSETSADEGRNAVSDWQRHSAPRLDQRGVARVGGVDVREAAGAD